MNKLMVFLLFFAAPAWGADYTVSSTVFAAEPTLRELELQAEVLKGRGARFNAEFERGKLQVEAGTLRQGMAIQGEREVDIEKKALEAKIEELRKMKNEQKGQQR